MTQTVRGNRIKEEEVFSCGILLHLFSQVALITLCVMSLSSSCLFLSTVGAVNICLALG